MFGSSGKAVRWYVPVYIIIGVPVVLLTDRLLWRLLARTHVHSLFVSVSVVKVVTVYMQPYIHIIIAVVYTAVAVVYTGVAFVL